VQKIHRLKPDRLEVTVQRLSGVKRKHGIQLVVQLDDVKSRNLHQLIEEDSGICGQLDQEEWEQDDELLCVHHAPQLIERSRKKDVEGDVTRKHQRRGRRSIFNYFLERLVKCRLLELRRDLSSSLPPLFRNGLVVFRDEEEWVSHGDAQLFRIRSRRNEDG